MSEKIAVIGSGISGVSAAYFLSSKFDVHLFEKKSRLGGHTRTIFIEDDNNLAIDTGFIVFNNKNYPDLIKFFNLLDVKYENSDMSFAVSNLISKIEYSGKNFLTLFASFKNVFSYKYIKMIFEVYKLYKLCNSFDLENNQNNITISEFLDTYNFSNYVRKFHIYPLISSIWSSNNNNVKNFPFVSFVNFFKNHGLFNLSNRPQWKYVLGGSKTYIDKIINLNLFKCSTNFSITHIYRKNSKIEIIDMNKKKYQFDKIVLATHADEALALISDATHEETDILSKFIYSKNTAILHSDQKLMPNKKNIWSSWNFIVKSKKNNDFTLTYWMNNLQNLKTKKNYFVTINPPFQPSTIKDITTFEHPIFNLSTLQAQKELYKIQGKQNTFFCGSYFGYGFHEDGIQSSALVAKLLGLNLPWTRDKNFINRLQFNVNNEV
ncbi:MAG: hypothetical protein CFH15_00245 [Alphaproteobacteria bacterium MarineAlpha5_Bin5]|nr:MAG: hypothetical protein CFH15_00245 [Alphaproteobacteria bacterium MarineAlpha5_Bin5]PPR52605.1 MAG: hypothetical protein CFH14_00243 [Alphaproteobacteria bacterium MarineAlpha5_Bin4]